MQCQFLNPILGKRAYLYDVYEGTRTMSIVFIVTLPYCCELYENKDDQLLLMDILVAIHAKTAD